jgi:solute carrier family 25 (adenine nucleotide translocator) protein 4/5/6/31
VKSKLANNFLASFALGFGTTIAAGWLSYPLDTLRRRLIMQPGSPNPYYNSFDALRKIIQNNGVSSLFAGAGANTARALIGTVALVGYDAVSGALFGK